MLTSRHRRCATQPQVQRAGSGLSALGLPACSPAWVRRWGFTPGTEALPSAPSLDSPRPVLCPAPWAGLWSLSCSQY